jgi:hypothetical protein
MASSAEPLVYTRIWYDFSGSSMANDARITSRFISNTIFLILAREPTANGSLLETQSSPEGVRLTGKEGGAEKDCHKVC